MQTKLDYYTFGRGEAFVIRRRSDAGTTYQTNTGGWTPVVFDKDVALYDEHGANLFLIGYEQAKRDAARALGI